jgi:DNA-binding CsgD family transcriptional regulator
VLRGLVADTEGAGLLRARAAAARELRRLGDRPAAPSGRAAAAAALQEGDVLTALTPREREIVALVGQGRSNKQVGAVLHLSEKTIENNLSRVYAKLGASSRSELVALVAARRAPAPAPA